MKLPTIEVSYRKAMFLVVAASTIAGAVTAALYLSSTINDDQASSSAGMITGLLVGGVLGLLVIERIEAATTKA